MPHYANGTPAPSNAVSLHTRSGTAAVLQAQDGDRIRIKNRRKRYLDLHPEYTEGSNLELADPLLYDRLIRRFQSADEREREGRERGYTGNLEADLMRSEAKLEALRHPDPNSVMAYRRADDGSITGVEADGKERAQSKEEGRARWEDVMRQRFLRGEDGDFAYEEVDESEEYDDRGEEEQRLLEEYLGGEDEEFVGEGKPRGETGVQDF
ncbi:hypothetical protein B0A55_06847 [Friedmanniomyces simplex]|uniref:CCD97-like C-terminal domain-containing protein n=1 Tax=Friedmanniomyces simplex TaxID=329884 RepID=A0A4U0XAC5_9PEZI|nr:hypothetical protein B0A55_06847 [Friedmanniomyces simplex]